MRNFVWSDDAVQKLAARFVCVTEECFDLDPPEWLDWVSNPESTRLFLTYKKNAPHLIPRGSSTAQGTYCMTADGEFLSGDFANNSRDGIVQILEQAWAQFEKKAAQKGWHPQPIPTEKIELSLGKAPQSGGLKFQVSSRDLPRGNDRRPGKDLFQRAAWNQRWVDFNAEEAALFMHAGSQPKTLPIALVKKLALTALKDNVRGQSSDWKETNFKSGTMTVQQAGEKAGRILLQYRGTVSLADAKRSYQAEIHGRAIYDTSATEGRFVQFQILAVGQRSDASTFNRRENDLAPPPWA
jgi:hypothetical protein